VQVRAGLSWPALFASKVLRRIRDTNCLL